MINLHKIITKNNFKDNKKHYLKLIQKIQINHKNYIVLNHFLNN